MFQSSSTWIQTLHLICWTKFVEPFLRELCCMEKYIVVVLWSMRCHALRFCHNWRSTALPWRTTGIPLSLAGERSRFWTGPNDTCDSVVVVVVIINVVLVVWNVCVNGSYIQFVSALFFYCSILPLINWYISLKANTKSRLKEKEKNLRKWASFLIKSYWLLLGSQGWLFEYSNPMNFSLLGKGVKYLLLGNVAFLRQYSASCKTANTAIARATSGRDRSEQVEFTGHLQGPQFPTSLLSPFKWIGR